MDPLDREIIALRHFEQLTLAETARVIGVSQSTASRRHMGAIERLREILSQLPGGAGEFFP
jgi:RNA polymerase sigma-70 factor (ECF subfamily)